MRQQFDLREDESSDDLGLCLCDFTGGKISHMTKVWHSGMTLKELRWA